MQIAVTSAAFLAAQVLAEVFTPPPPIDYLAWAEANVVFSERGTDFPGPYNRRMFPLLDEPMRALAPDDPCRTVTIMASAQASKTTLATIFTAGSLDLDTGDILYTVATEALATKWSKTRLSPMLKQVAPLAAAFPQAQRDRLDSVFYKERADGRAAIYVGGANSENSLSSISVKRQVQDELSKWEVNDAGDPESQADDRSLAFEFAKVLKSSTPLVMPGCKITNSFLAGSQEKPYVPCPHCGEFQVLEWENMLAALDPERPEDAHFTCIACGAVIEQHHRSAMVTRVEWRADNPQAARHHRSFWWWAAYFPLQSWERIARKWLDARGAADSEQTFLNQTAGKAFQAKSEAPPWEDLKKRADMSEHVAGLVPPSSLVLFMGIDCQGDRVEWQVIGYGRNRRRDVIAYGVVPGHISERAAQTRLDDVMAQTFPADNGHRIGIERAAIDGNAYTEDVWEWAKRHSHARLIMVRGLGKDGAPSLQRVQREINPKTGKKLKYARRFYNFGTSARKMGLYRDLAKDDPLAYRYIGLPRGLPDEYFQQLTAERRVGRKSNGTMIYRWDDDNQRNEALDTFLQADAAAENWGVRGLPETTWDRFESERAKVIERQGDLEDLIGAPLPSAVALEIADDGKANAAKPRRSGFVSGWRPRR